MARTIAGDDPAAEIGVLGVLFDNAACCRKGTAFAPDKIREISAQAAAITEEGYSLAAVKAIYEALGWVKKKLDQE